MKHDLDFALFEPLDAAQIWFLVTGLMEESICRRYAIDLDDLFTFPRTKRDRVPVKHATAVERLMFYLGSHCPDSAPPGPAVLTVILRNIASINWTRAVRNSLMAQLFPQGWWTFMNYGFHDEAYERRPLRLRGIERQWRLATQLYDRLASVVDLTDGVVLDAGSGRGGGAAYLARSRRARAVVGLDASISNTSFSREHHNVRGLKFVVGLAEALPFSDGTFDAVLSIEAANHFASFERFAAEAHRVLRADGHLLIAFDGTPIAAMDMRSQVLASGFRSVRDEDISAGVRTAILEWRARGLESLLKATRTIRDRRLIESFMLRPTTANQILTGECSYFAFVLAKVASCLPPHKR